MSDSPAAVLVDVSGSLMAVTASALIPSGTQGVLVAGVGDDGVVRFPIIDSNGAVKVLTSSLQAITGAVHVTNLPLEVTGTVGVGGPFDVTGSIFVENQVTVTSTSSLPIALVRNDVTSAVSGAVHVTNLPLEVTGNVGVGGPFDVTGSVFVENQLTVTSTGSLPTVLFDASGSKMAVTASAQIPSGVQGLLMAGVGEDGITRFPVIDNSGSFQITGNVGIGAPVTATGEIRVAKGDDDLVYLDTIDTRQDVGRLKATLYTPSGDPVAFPAASEAIRNEFVTNSLGDSSLTVDGSVTPVTFSYGADPEHDVSIQSIKFTIVANSITFGNDYFGSARGPLPNGLLVCATVNSGSYVCLYNMTQNESFVNFASPGGFTWIVSSKDLSSSEYILGGGLILVGGTNDRIDVIVRDDIDSAAVYFKCFVKGNIIQD